MFYKQSSYRYQRSKGFKVKHAFQIALLVAVSIWLLYQVKHSHDRRQAYDEKKNGGQVEGSEDGGNAIGRKGKFEVFERSSSSINGGKNEGNIEEEGESRDIHDNVRSGENGSGDHGGGDDEIDRHEEERGEEEARQEEKDKETEGEIENVVNAEEGKRGDLEEEEQNGDIGSKFMQLREENEESTEASNELQDNGNEQGGEIPEFKDENHVEEERNVGNQSESEEENTNVENQSESEEENKNAEGQNDAGEDNNGETRREAEEDKNSESQKESEEDKNPETQRENEDTKITETQNDVKEDKNTEKQGEGQEEKISEAQSDDQENKNVEKGTEGKELKIAEKFSSGEEDKTIEKQGETEAERNGEKQSGSEDDKNSEQSGSEEGKNVEQKSDNEEFKDVEKHSTESLGEQQMAPPLGLDGENKEKNSIEPGEVPNIVLKQSETVEASPDPKGDHSEEKTLDSGKIANIGSVKNESDAVGGSNDVPAVDSNAKEGGEKLEEQNQDSNATSADSNPNPNVETENAKLEEISKEVNKSLAADHEAAGLDQNSTVILESQAETLTEPNELATPEAKKEKESEVTGQAQAENIKIYSSIDQGAVRNKEGQSHYTKSDNVEGNVSTNQNSESSDQNQAVNEESSSKTNETSEGVVNSTTSEENSTTGHRDNGDVTSQEIPGENEAHDRTDLGTLPDTETGGQNSEEISVQ